MTALFYLKGIGTSAPEILFLIVAIYFLIYYFIYLRQTKRWKKSNIPFLQPTFLIGHKSILRLTKYVVSVPLDEIYKENTSKDLIGFFLGTMSMIMLKDRKLIRDISVKYSKQTFATGLYLPESEVEAQYTINLTSDEKKWKFGRMTLIPVLSPNWFHGPRFEKIKEAIQELWNITDKAEADGSPIKPREVCKTILLTIVTSYFGIDSSSPELKQGARKVVEELVNPSYLKVVGFSLNSFLPSLQMFECFRLMPRKTCDFMSKILRQKINQRDQMNIETGDFIDILRSLRNKAESNNSCNKDSDIFPTSGEMPTRPMTGIAMVLLTGAMDTVYGLLNFAIHALSLYPDYQRRIRKEVREALKKRGDSEFSYEVVQSLEFTHQCLMEVARLFAPSFSLRECSEDFQIQGTKYIIRKGDRLILPFYSLGRDETQFRDPHSFDPDRFTSESSNFVDPGTLLSFGVGPRKCPGYKQGLFMATALLAALLYKYDLKPRSHLKLMDATDFNPKTITNTPRKELLVDLVRCKNYNGV